MCSEVWALIVERAALPTRRTFLQPTSRGFTLIELMVVVAIIAGAVMLATPYLTNRNAQTRAFLRQFTVLSRELHTKAKLQGAVYRLVIDLSQEVPGRESEPQTYWVERSVGKTVLSENEEEQAHAREQETDDEKKQDPKGFQIDNSVLKEAKELPSGLRIEKVELTRLKNPITSGKAFIHYMPEGLTDEAAIHIKGSRTQAWTVSIHPLTGRAELISKPLSLKEITAQ